MSPDCWAPLGIIVFPFSPFLLLPHSGAAEGGAGSHQTISPDICLQIVPGHGPVRDFELKQILFILFLRALKQKEGSKLRPSNQVLRSVLVGVWVCFVFLRKTEISIVALFSGSTQKSNPLSLPLQLRGAKDSHIPF